LYHDLAVELQFDPEVKSSISVYKQLFVSINLYYYFIYPQSN